MPTSKETVAYILDQLAPLPVRARAMFGEYGLYCDEKIVALICDDTLFVKPTAIPDELFTTADLAPPYPGAKDYYVVHADQLEDRDWLQNVIARVSAPPATQEKAEEDPDADGMISSDAARDRLARRVQASTDERPAAGRDIRNARNQEVDVSEKPAGGFEAPGEYAPAGEAQGMRAAFTAEQIAQAFDVSLDRVQNAMAGEFALAPNDRIDSRQAQHLAEVILGDLPQAEREAGLMRLGAFTPRRDHEWGIGEAAPGEESDRVVGDDDHVSQH